MKCFLFGEYAEHDPGHMYLPEPVLVQTLDGKYRAALRYIAPTIEPRSAASDRPGREASQKLRVPASARGTPGQFPEMTLAGDRLAVAFVANPWEGHEDRAGSRGGWFAGRSGAPSRVLSYNRRSSLRVRAPNETYSNCSFSVDLYINSRFC